jgi:hypothetical protein
VSLVLLLGRKGFAGVTSSKVNSTGVPKAVSTPRVAVTEITGSTPTFLRVTLTPGPPGLGGPIGPTTDTISIGSSFCDAETECPLNTVSVRSVAVRRTLRAMIDAGLLGICYFAND